MKFRQQIQVPQPIAGAMPRYRYWGDQKPPKALAAVAMASPRLSVDSTKATIRLYGPIDPWGGFWGVSAKEVAAALDGMDDTVTEVQLRVNSPGGSCWEGLAILNLLRAHPAKVTAVVDGLAASAASFIVTGCDDRVMSPGTQMMIHSASASAWGCNSAEMRKTAGILDKIDQSMADLYAEATGGKSADWLALMVEETWYTAIEAAASGLADRVEVVPDAGSATTAGEDDEDPALDPSENPENAFDLSMYRHPGRTHASAPAATMATPNPPSASAVGSHPTEGGTAMAFTPKQLTTMRSTLELPETADEAAITAAVEAVAAENIEERTTPAAQVPEGHVVIPQAALADLQTNAALGAQASEQLRIQARDRFLDEHRDRFAPASRAAWERQYDTDAESTQTYLASAPVIVPTSELGHADEATASEDVTESDSYKNWSM